MDALVSWFDDDPQRLTADLEDVAAFAGSLSFQPAPADLAHHGMWVGSLPVWPFERLAPEGLEFLVPTGLKVAVMCSAAHPVLPPVLVPIDPEPALSERSMHAWHVSPGGNLCLMQSTGDWLPTDKISDLLLKACGWRIEYALMKLSVLDEMTLGGIVDDDRLDELIAHAASSIRDRGNT